MGRRPVLHTKVHRNRSTGCKEEDYKALPYMGVEAIWSCDQHYINIFSFPCLHTKFGQTRIDVYETCPKQMLVHKGGKIKNWVGSAEMSHLQNCSLKIYLKRALGGGGVRMV